MPAPTTHDEQPESPESTPCDNCSHAHSEHDRHGCLALYCLCPGFQTAVVNRDDYPLSRGD